MKTLKTLLLCCAAVLGLASCAYTGNPHAQRHPLNGKVWDAQARRLVDPALVAERATAARFVLLGEIHDNATHHRIQADILDAIVKSGRRPALVMEQYDVEQQEKLNAILQGDEPQEGKLRALSDLMRKGWDWPLYRPLLATALQYKLPVIAANLSRESLRHVSRNGFEALGSGEQTRLAIEAVWSPERQRQLDREIALGHCGKMPDHMLQSVSKAQRARDAVMADKLLMARRSGAVTIIGRNHARQDMGVPLYLAARAPGETVLSVGLTEVHTPTEPAAYTYGPLGQRHDLVWFTAPTRRKSDPCDSIPAAIKVTG